MYLIWNREKVCMHPKKVRWEGKGGCTGGGGGLFQECKTNPVSSVHFSMTQDATGYVCLLIQPTKKDDAGWYTVSAKNEAGVVSCTCRLDIYG